MALLDSLRPVAALTSLLERERSAILKSDFETLEELFKSKEALMFMVAKSRPSQHSLKQLKKMSDRNRRLLMASARGIKTARARLLAMRDTSRSFSAYGPAGTTTTIGNKSLTMKRKA